MDGSSQRRPAGFPRSQDVRAGVTLDRHRRSRPEQEVVREVRLGAYEAGGEAVGRDRLVVSVGHDVGVEEQPGGRGQAVAAQGRAVGAHRADGGHLEHRQMSDQRRPMRPVQAEVGRYGDGGERRPRHLVEVRRRRPG